MYCVDSLRYAIEHLFYQGVGDRGYTEDEIRLLLEGIDYEALLQVVRHNAQTVHAYTTQGKALKAFNYRGGDLFDQRATLLYEDFDQSWAGIVTTARNYELWLLEDMSLMSVACVSLDCGDGEYVTEYREIKTGDPWETGMILDLEELSGKLLGLCGLHSECVIPIYEL